MWILTDEFFHDLQNSDDQDLLYMWADIQSGKTDTSENIIDRESYMNALTNMENLLRDEMAKRGFTFVGNF